MYNKQNGVASVRGHRTMNLLVSVVDTRLWASFERLRRHMLNILQPYISWDVWRFEISPNHHVFPVL